MTSAKIRPSRPTVAQLHRLQKSEVERPMRMLVEQLPRMTTCAAGGIDFANCSASLLANVAGNAETTAALMGRGLSAIGCLMAYAAVEIEDGSITSDSVEALGWLMAELGDIAAVCFVLASRCRQAMPAPPQATWTPIP
jgi:hypothetical protein